MRNSTTWQLTTALLVLLLFLYGLAFDLSGILDSAASLRTFEKLIPYDSILYVENSETVSFPDLTFVDVFTGALNWLSLSIVYKILNDVGGFGALGFVLINCLCFYQMVRLGPTSVSAVLGMSRANVRYYPILLFICSPFLFAWIMVPNKELLVAVGILGAMHAIATRRVLRFVILTTAVGLIKVQLILATLLYLSLRKFPRRKTVTLVGISLVYPLVYGAVPGLQMSNFLDVNENEIRSAPVVLAIDELSSYPFGYILIFPMRLVLNLLGGLNPIRIIEAGFSPGALAPLTSFILGLLTMMSIYFMVKWHDVRRVLAANSDKSFYVFCLLVVSLTVPFMQPRYYWWAIPVLLAYLLYGNPRRNIAASTVPAGYVQRSYS